jgi:trimeric autotransporter adhesin
MYATLPAFMKRPPLARSLCLCMVALLCLVLIVPARAVGPAFLVKNINTTPSPSLSSNPQDFIAIGSTVYFSAVSKGYRGLWKSDGTAAGTVLVKEITPTELTNVNGTLFFVATDGATGRELWKSDGTAAGTTLVKAISPRYLTNVNGTLFFAGDDDYGECLGPFPIEGVTGCELWKSDGTTAGTVLVKDIGSGAIGSFPFALTNVNGTLFFLGGRTGNAYTELWKSNGTAAGTVKITPSGTPTGTFNSPGNLTNINGTLFLSAAGGAGPDQLWKSNGTDAGTVLVQSIPNTELPYLQLTDFTNVNGTLFFQVCTIDPRCTPTLWKSNGTAAGTVLLKNVRASNLVNSSGTLFFLTITDRSLGAQNVALWKSDGTPAGTTLVKQIAAGSEYRLGNMITINNTLFFMIDMIDMFQGNTSASQLWKSDGTATGTTPVTTINDPGLLDKPDLPLLTQVNGQLFFVGYSSVGDELWKSNGTATGTTLVKDINGPVNAGSSPLLKTSFKGQLFFVADDGVSGSELWKSNGTATGTTMVKDLTPGAAHSKIYDLLVIGQTLFLLAGDGLWKSDGTAAGTTLVKAFSQPVRDVDPSLASLNGSLFILLSGTSGGTELWRSNGSNAGTTLVKQLDGISGGFFSVEGRLFFSLNLPPQPGAQCCTPTADAVPGLWVTNGTAAGTIPASTLFGLDFAGAIGGMNGTFFLWGSRGGTSGLWKSQGTPNSTVLLKESIYAPFMATINGTLFFAGTESTYGSELWASDGTAAGTRLVKDIVPGTDFSSPAFLTNVHGRLFFFARYRIQGGYPTYELWTSDGTTAGTTLVKNIRPDTKTPVDSTPEPFVLGAVGRTLFFSISDGVHGQEIWKSDGTAAGTTLAHDIAPGGAASTPDELTIAGPHIFFSANDQSNGTELWAIRGDIDTFVQSPRLAGAPPSSPAAVPIQYGNIGIASASPLTLTATLHPALTYIGDTSGITPTVSGQTLTWHIADASVVSGRSFTLSVGTPNAAYGSTYPVALTLAVAGQESYPADNTATIQVMIARQVYLPFARR